MMKIRKLLKNKLVVVFMLIISLLAVWKFKPNILSIVGGARILSISNVQILSNDKDISGDYWLMSIVAEQGYDKLYGTIREGDLTYGNYKNGNGFEITIEPTKPQECLYKFEPILNKDNELRNLRLEVKTFGFYPVCDDNQAKTWCSQLGGFRVKRYAFSCTYSCWIRDARADGYVAEPIPQGLGIKSWEEKISVRNLNTGKTITATISENQPEVLLKDGGKVLGKIVWNGNLEGNFECDTPSDAKAVYFSMSNTWRFVDEDDLDAYKQLVRLEPNYVDGQTTLEEDKSYVEKRRLALYKLYSSLPDDNFASATWKIQTNTLGVASLTPLGKVIIPNFNLYLSTDFLPKISIIQEVGKPKILYVSDVKMESSGQGTIQIKNIGEVPAIFSWKITCPTIDTPPAKQTPKLNPNEETTDFFTLTADNSHKYSETCRAEAWDINNPTQKDVAYFNVDVEPTCTLKCGINTHLDYDKCECVCELPEVSGKKLIKTETTCYYEDEQITCNKECGVGAKLNPEKCVCECILPEKEGCEIKTDGESCWYECKLEEGMAEKEMKIDNSIVLYGGLGLLFIGLGFLAQNKRLLKKLFRRR